MQRNLILVSGPRGSGKTTLCLLIRDLARQSGLTCAGLISPGQFQAQGKVGIDLMDVRSGERRPLAQAGNLPGKLRTAAFRFDTDTVEWGNQLLGAACPCDVLIVDELGPLELERGQGWTRAIDVLRSGQFQLAVVVVRPSLVNDFRGLVNSGPSLFRTESVLSLPDVTGAHQAIRRIMSLASNDAGES